MIVPPDTPLIAQERLDLMDLMDTGTYKIPTREVDVNFVMGTWNIQQFSEKKTCRSLKYMADIIERFDIVAIQELKTDLRGLNKLLAIMPGDYKFLVSDATGNSERFAFIYDQRTVKPTGLVSDLAFEVPGGTHMGFQIHRMPYCASFKLGRFDFTVVSVHIFQSDKDWREEEIIAVADRVKKLSEKEQSKVFDRDFFVVGDFNIKKAGDRFFKALVERDFLMPDKLNSLTTNFNRTGTYDKIAWVDRNDFYFSGKVNVVPYYKAVYQDKSPAGGKKEISDHLPLWAEFKINELTQQLNSAVFGN
jgi:endonuclease/exonuclease/phosphatase family metal-dependent hydrolase